MTYDSDITLDTTADSYVDTVIDGKYRCDQKIGEGGMGVVYAGTQIMVGRKVAIKLLHPRFTQDKGLRSRFEVEAKAVGKLNHPNCITLYDFGYSNDLNAFYTVVEFIDGEALNDKFLVSGRALPSFADTIDIIKQIAAGLEHAHLHGILHRDLKPENIMMARMIDGSEVAKVLDFGIAQIVKGTFAPTSDSQRLTKQGDIFGTPPYMSPEQAYGDRQLTPACDFYALGIIFYELIDGRLPFMGTTAMEFLLKHVQEPPPALRRRDVPDQLQNIIYWLLDKDPQRRPQSGKELIQALNSLQLHSSEPHTKYYYLSREEQLTASTAAPASAPTLDTADLHSQSSRTTQPRYSTAINVTDNATNYPEIAPTQSASALNLTDDDLMVTAFAANRQKVIAIAVIAIALFIGGAYWFLADSPTENVIEIGGIQDDVDNDDSLPFEFIDNAIVANPSDDDINTTPNDQNIESDDTTIQDNSRDDEPLAAPTTQQPPVREPAKTATKAPTKPAPRTSPTKQRTQPNTRDTSTSEKPSSTTNKSSDQEKKEQDDMRLRPIKLGL